MQLSVHPVAPKANGLRRGYPVLLFLAFLVAGFGFQRLHAWAGGLLSPKQAVQKHAKEVATAFQPFAPKVKTRSDEKYFYVESNGMPDQTMMVGITNWQQQVPLPQSYVGQNAWQFPLTPVPAANPLSAKNHFFRGAMAIAVDGVPIFNALNNRGEDSFAIGELDAFGGHCGRADDYHYHIAPLHLTKTVGKDKPVGYALDGYALYGLTEPDGSPVGKLDAFNGHTTLQLGYHYHGTRTYPYLNGGFHGEVVEHGGQVDPQPRANPVRPDTRPLRGAKITGFEQPRAGNYSLTYILNGETYKINYALQANGSYKFDYVDAQGRVTSQTYSGRGFGGGRGDGNGPPPRRDGEPGLPPRPGDGNGPPPPRPDDEPGQPGQQEGPGGGGQGGQGRGGQRGGPGGGQIRGSGLSVAARESSNTHPLKGFVLSSPSIGADGVLPKEFTGDGDASTLPLEWKGGPAETKSYAVIMHHIDPQGVVKWYWTLYNIPPTMHSLPKNVRGVGTLGTNSVNDRVGYAPPHSQGPGRKDYILTLYALSEEPKITAPAYTVSRAALLAAMKGHILATAELRVNYTRFSNGPNDGVGRGN